jgi:pimeloyl-ACP methyl ester carboxylesterase
LTSNASSKLVPGIVALFQIEDAERCDPAGSIGHAHCGGSHAPVCHQVLSISDTVASLLCTPSPIRSTVESMAPRAVLAVAIATTAALLTSGCTGSESGGPPRSSPQSQTTDATTAESADDVVETEQDIDIGGREVYLRCWGEPVPGEPTILLLSGSDLHTSSWELMAPDFATEGHHLCAYDRLGVGRSDPPLEARRTTKDQVDDLVALLDAADLQEPVVLVAHSLGSLPAVGLVDRAAERVAGIVLVDPWSPRVAAAQRAALPPKKADEIPELAELRRFVTDVMYDPSQTREHLLLAEDDEQAVKLFDDPGPFFRNLPVVVLKSPRLPYLPGLPRSFHEATIAAMDEGAEEFAAESTRGTLIKVKDTGHNIQEDRPEVVMHAIRDVIGR